MAAEAVGDPEGSKLIKESSSVQESGGDFRNGQEEKEKEGGEKRREEDKLAQRVIEIMEKDNIEEKEKEKSHLKKGESTTSVDTETIAKGERKDKEDPQKEEKTEDIENKKNQRGKEKGGHSGRSPNDIRFYYKLSKDKEGDSQKQRQEDKIQLTANNFKITRQNLPGKNKY